MASMKDRVPRFSVYQLGRGNEPMMVVGSVFPLVAFSILVALSLQAQKRAQGFYNATGHS
jgi:hypothetical protein